MQFRTIVLCKPFSASENIGIQEPLLIANALKINCGQNDFTLLCSTRAHENNRAGGFFENFPL